jgi:hypothetical protein
MRAALPSVSVRDTVIPASSRCTVTRRTTRVGAPGRPAKTPSIRREAETTNSPAREIVSGGDMDLRLRV